MKPRPTYFRRPPLPPEAIAAIEARKARGETWLSLSQDYGISAFTLQKRVQAKSGREGS